MEKSNPAHIVLVANNETVFSLVNDLNVNFIKDAA